MTTKTKSASVSELAMTIKGTLSPGEIAQLIRLIQPTPTTGELSPEEFESLMEKLDATNSRRGFSEKSIEAARLILVMGAVNAEAAAETGLSRQAVNQLMGRIRRRMNSVPAGWVKVDQWLPVEVAGQLDKIAKDLKHSPQGAEVTFHITVGQA